MKRTAKALWMGDLKAGKGRTGETVTRHGSDRAVLEAAAGEAKADCRVSKVLNAAISMDAKFETWIFFVAERSTRDTFTFS